MKQTKPKQQQKKSNQHSFYSWPNADYDVDNDGDNDENDCV